MNARTVASALRHKATSSSRARDRTARAKATFVGPDVAELLHSATITIVGEVPMRVLAHALPSFPTRSELWLKLVGAYEQDHGTLHAGRVHANG